MEILYFQVDGYFGWFSTNFGYIHNIFFLTHNNSNVIIILHNGFFYKFLNQIKCYKKKKKHPEQHVCIRNSDQIE